MKDSHFWNDAHVYDIATNAYTDDVEYWQRMISEDRPRRVLELACGTGRIAFPLLESGLAADADFQFVGLDRSAEFLKRAQTRLEAAGVADHAAFVEGDMRSFSLDGVFDLIIIAYNSFSFLFEIEDQIQCLTAVQRHLAPGGRLAIDLHMPPLDLIVKSRNETFPTLHQELQMHRPGPGIARVTSSFVTTNYDQTTQTENTSHYIEIFHENGSHESHPYDITWHHVFPRELELLMRAAGLTVVERFGTYDRSPFSQSSRQYLWIMQSA